MEEVPLGVERGPNLGGRRPKGRPLGPTSCSVCLGHASHPEDQSRDLECRDGCIGVRWGTGSLGSGWKSYPHLGKWALWRAGQGTANPHTTP